MKVKMKQLQSLQLLCVLVLWLGIVGFVQKVDADEGNGGQVSINGKISFEETEESSRPSNPTSSSSFGSKGVFPKTGERLNRLGIILGLELLVLFCLLFLRKSRKERIE